MSDVLAYLEHKTALALARSVTPAEAQTLYKYLNLLIKWQRSQRLVGSDDPRWIVDNVIVDSLLFKRALPDGVAKLADVGSGAGIPGVPLAVALPEVAVTLIEARQKRGSFLAAAIRELGLRSCTLVNQRLEDVRADLAGTFDAVVLRCAGNPISLLPDLRSLLARGGTVVASGPPERLELSVGSWLEVDGPDGMRRFWVYQAA